MDQDELTRTKFHSVTRADGRLAHLYRLGDKGFLDENGKLHIQGRIGNREIKVRGFRADLQEVEKSIVRMSPDITMVSLQLLGDSLVGLLVPASVGCERVRRRLLEDAPKELSFALAEQSVFVPCYGMLDGLQEFKASAYSIPEVEAAEMDPQKRIFLDVASEALADADMAATPGSAVNSVGVFVGAAPNTFLSSEDNPGHKNRDDATPLSFANHYQHLLDCPIATFTLYKLNTTGPNVTLNTACSSVLTALQLACASLSQGDCGAALVGGVSVAFPHEKGYISAAGGDSYAVFSPTGFCYPLDARSDGCAPADGVAAVVVKRLHDARAAHDRVYAVIEGIAIGSDGAVGKAGLGVPSASGQSRTVEAALRRAGTQARDRLRYVEMHGSGTPWGDALEVQGLKLALERFGRTVPSAKGAQTTSSGEPSSTVTKIFVGSNKGNLGNAEAASGLLSLVKASLSPRRGIVPPLPNLTEPSPLCEFEESRFEPLGKPMKLEPEDRVGVTSLGYGGSNGHVVLSAAPLFGLEQKDLNE